MVSKRQKDPILDFFEIIRLFSDNFVFRGQARKKWRLEPSVVRLNPPGTEGRYKEFLLHHEEGVLRNFRKYGQSLPPEFRGLASHWEWLAIAQHHRLPTRLLDWSWSPLVGLYFTLAGMPGDDDGALEGDGALWCVNMARIMRTNPRRTQSLLDGYLKTGYGPYSVHVEKLKQLEKEYHAPPHARQRGAVPGFPDLSFETRFVEHFRLGLGLFDEKQRGDYPSDPAAGLPTLWFTELPPLHARLSAQSGLFSMMSGAPRAILGKRELENRVRFDLRRESADPDSPHQPNGSSPRGSDVVEVHGDWIRVGRQKFDVGALEVGLQHTLGDRRGKLLCALLDHYARHDRTTAQCCWKPLYFKIVVPGTAKRRLRDWLSFLNVHSRSLFPDLDGLASHVRRLFDPELAMKGVFRH